MIIGPSFCKTGSFWASLSWEIWSCTGLLFVDYKDTACEVLAFAKAEHLQVFFQQLILDSRYNQPLKTFLSGFSVDQMKETFKNP
jgi:hypothetical protein